MDLFITPEPSLEKSAAETTLPEDPNQWAHEVLQEFYKQVPYAADFSPHVQMVKVDGERGYGFGHVEVMNQTEMQSGESPEAMTAAGIRQARVPVIIRDGMLQPFDIMVTDDSKVLPLTEIRLRAAVFRPQAFDVTGRTPGDQAMIGQLYPPYRQNYGFGGGGVAMNAGMGKEGSALEDYLSGKEKTADVRDEVEAYLSATGKQGRFGKKTTEGTAKMGMLDEFIAKHASANSGPLLGAILPTVGSEVHAQFVQFVTAHQPLFLKNAAALLPSMQLLLSHAPESAEKTAGALLSLIRPTVAQVRRGESDYTIKTASHLFWEPREERVDRGEVIRRFGEKVALAADLSGAATISEDGAAPEEDSDTMDAVPITESGFYKVRDAQGGELVGAVIAGLLDTDGKEIPLALFTNGSQSAVQGDIVGSPADVQGFSLPTADVPSGSGFFFKAMGNEVCATIPMTLQGSFADQGEPTTYQGETHDGRPVQVSVQPNIQMVLGTEDKMLIPQGWQWSPLSGTQSVSLESSMDDAQLPTEAGPEAAFEGKEATAHVHLVSNGAGTFSVRGAPVEKLAHAEREALGTADVMFLLAGLGVNSARGLEKLAEATLGAAPVRVNVAQELKLASDQRAEALADARRALADFPTPPMLWKEAAELTDPMAVDTVLSLGFLNPENLMTFIGYLPAIEESQQRICNLLLAARLGQSEIPQNALEKSVRATEEVLEGLKALAFQSN